MFGILTSIIGIAARGRNAKAIASAIPGIVTGLFLGPQMVDAFQQGFMDAGTIPVATELGRLLGGLLVGGFHFVFTWLSPKNA